jgi:hypothetical protein
MSVATDISAQKLESHIGTFKIYPHDEISWSEKISPSVKYQVFLWCIQFIFLPGAYTRVLARIKFKGPKKHVATMMTHCLWQIFLVKCQKQ